MWHPGAVVILRLCLFTFIYLTVTDCRLVPVTKSFKRALDRKDRHVPVQNFMKMDKKLFENIKIPNSEFCSEMVLRPEDHYLVLPWWYNYCQDLRENHVKGVQGNINYASIHKYILAEVQLYKKRMNEKNVKLSELEKELISINNA